MTIKAYEFALLEAMKKESTSGHYHGTYRDLVDLTGWEVKTVMKYVKRLIAGRQLEVVVRGRSGNPTIYKIKEGQ
jgi:hypothetical protein